MIVRIINLTINLLKYYFDGLRTPSLSGYARLLLFVSSSITFGAYLGWDLSLNKDAYSFSASNKEVGIDFILGVLFIGVSVILMFIAFLSDRADASRKQLFQISHIGLMPNLVSDIRKFLPKKYSRCNTTFLNITFPKSHKESNVDSLQKQIDKIREVKSDILKLSVGSDSNNQILCYGGVAPVPFLLSAGHILGNMQDVIVGDWDRFKKQWHFNSGFDDGSEISIIQDSKNPQAHCINLVVSLSLEINIEHIHNDFPSLDIIEIRFKDNLYKYDRLCSLTKQQRIAKQIIEKINELNSKYKNLAEINLFIGAQASFVFQLGSQLNQVHLPTVNCYHFDNSLTKVKHPWGVVLKAGREEKCRIITHNRRNN